MVGVGSGSALNAFNIGQQSGQGNTAIGMAIRDIVAKGDSLAPVREQAALTGIASLESQRRGFANDSAPVPLIERDPVTGAYTQGGQPYAGGTIPGNAKLVQPPLTEAALEAVYAKMLDEPGQGGAAAEPSALDPLQQSQNALKSFQSPEVSAARGQLDSSQEGAQRVSSGLQSLGQLGLTPEELRAKIDAAIQAKLNQGI